MGRSYRSQAFVGAAASADCHGRDELKMPMGT